MEKTKNPDISQGSFFRCVTFRKVKIITFSAKYLNSVIHPIKIYFKKTTGLKEKEIMMKVEFIGNQGDFCMENPDLISGLYFPLANESGVMSCVSPDLGETVRSIKIPFLCLP
jgi:hypothetical protein